MQMSLEHFVKPKRKCSKNEETCQKGAEANLMGLQWPSIKIMTAMDYFPYLQKYLNKCKEKRKLLYRIPINSSRRNDGNRKSPLANITINCCKQKTMAIFFKKKSRQMCGKKQNIYTVLKYLFPEDAYYKKNLPAEKPGRHHLNQMIKVHQHQYVLYQLHEPSDVKHEDITTL